jgi:hypothetical protein
MVIAEDLANIIYYYAAISSVKVEATEHAKIIGPCLVGVRWC